MDSIGSVEVGILRLPGACSYILIPCYSCEYVSVVKSVRSPPLMRAIRGSNPRADKRN